MKKADVEPAFCFAGVQSVVTAAARSSARRFFTADIKTGKSVYMEARLQIAAYAQALQEMGHQRSELGVVIRLPKVETDPGFEVVPVLNLDEEHSAFLHVMELFKRVQAHDKERGWIKGAS